jgi:hypothetical protein
VANHPRISAATAVAAVATLAALADGGSIILYSGTEPAYADSAAGTECATCEMAATAYGTAAADGTNHWAAVDLAATATDASATGGTPTYFRMKTAAGAVITQGTVSTSGADLNLTAAAIAADAQVDITSLVIRLPYNGA